MSVLYLVLPASMLLALGAVLAFRWAARRGQFDDLDTPAWRAVMDDAPSGNLQRPHAETPQCSPPVTPPGNSSPNGRSLNR